MLYIFAGSAVVVTLLAAACLYLVGWGLIGFNAGEYNLPEQSEYKGWQDVFDGASKIGLKPLMVGRTHSNSLPYYMNLDTFKEPPENFVPENLPLFSYLVNHPSEGDILIDAGLHSSYTRGSMKGNSTFLVKIFQKKNKMDYLQEAGQDTGSQIVSSGAKIKKLFLTHLHPDHTSGLPALADDSPVIFGKKEDSFYYRLICRNNFKGKKNVQTLDFDKGRALAPFDKVIDLFGDGSLWALSTPGHTVDHISYFINDKDNPALLVGDAICAKHYYEKGYDASNDTGAVGAALTAKSSNAIKEFKKRYPGVKIYFSHDDRQV